MRGQRGSIYVVQRWSDQLVKIGWTRHDPQGRIAEIRRQHGTLTVLSVFVGTYGRELRLHKRFSHCLASGREWFFPAPDLLATLDRRGRS